MHEGNIARFAKDLHGRIKLTQEQFAQKVSVTYSIVNHWENSKTSSRGGE